MSGGGGHAVGGFDELWLTVLRGSLLEMDSNMQHDDDDSDTVTLLAPSRWPTNQRRATSARLLLDTCCRYCMRLHSL